MPWINSGELNESFITATDNYISEFGLNNSSAKIYPANSILVALYGATAGKVSFLSFEASSNQAVCGVIPNHANLTEYLYIALSSLCKYYISLSTGSARDNISQATVKDTLLLFPNNKILGEFHILASKIFDKIINCQLEILNLTKQRDELLPLMMSSQVSVMPSEVNCDLYLLQLSILLTFDHIVLHNIRTPQQDGESCRGVDQRVMGALADGVRGGCRRCGSRGLGWRGGAGSFRRRSGGNRELWRSVSASG